MVNGELTRCLPNAQRVTIPAADHNLLYEAAAPVGDAITEFIRSLKK